MTNLVMAKTFMLYGFQHDDLVNKEHDENTRFEQVIIRRTSI